MSNDPTIDSIDHTAEFLPFAATIPLSRLMLSTLNVRQTERDADVASLAEDIHARGLKQNLVVCPAHFSTILPDNYPKDGFEVIAGGRRFQAMQLLVADGRLPHDQPISCLVEPRNQAAETSLSENLHRVAMNPADEFEAFAVIVALNRRVMDEAAAIATCAKRFGVTARHVTERMRLAALAPEILEALRKGHIGLDSAKAYAGTADRELQVKVFLDQAKPGVWKAHDATNVRAALRNITVPLDHAHMLFIGLDAYRAAGGRTEFEMFMGTDSAERAIDANLLADLAHAKAEKLVPARAKKDGYVSGLLAKGHGSGARWPKEPPEFERRWDYNGQPPKAERKECVAVYAIDCDGDGLMWLGRFKPIEEKPEPEPARDWQAERAAERRQTAIQYRAARLATAPARDTLRDAVGAEMLFWPAHLRISAVELQYPESDDGEVDPDFAFVAVQIKVPWSEVAARMAEAEQLVDAEAAAPDAAKDEAPA